MKAALAVLFAVAVPVWAATQQPVAMPSGIEPAKRVISGQQIEPKVVVKPAKQEERKADNSIKAATKAPEASVGPTIMN